MQHGSGWKAGDELKLFSHELPGPPKLNAGKYNYKVKRERTRRRFKKDKYVFVQQRLKDIVSP